MRYYIYVAYHDGTVYTNIIEDNQDIAKLFNNKYYEFVRIFYLYNPRISHIIHGRDNVFINMVNNIIQYAQYNDNHKTTTLTELNGYGKETTRIVNTINLPNRWILKGKTLDDNTFIQIVDKGLKWSPSNG